MNKKQEDSVKDDFNPESIPFPDQRGRGCACGADKAAPSCDDAGEKVCDCARDGKPCECGAGEACECSCSDAEPSGPENVDARLNAIVTENTVLRDMLARTSADFDNFRKRTVRDKEDVRKSANADLVGALIPVLDTMVLAMDAARKHHPEAASVIDGIDMIITQFKGVLKTQGVEEINPQNGAFDPNLHESIATQPSDEVEEGKVCAVARIGYSLNGKLIRPASVVISSGKAK